MIDLHIFENTNTNQSIENQLRTEKAKFTEKKTLNKHKTDIPNIK